MAAHRIQHYMEKHKITPLFEDLMNRLLHDQPDEPLIYLITALYRKAGLQVPKDLKSAGHRRHSPDKAGRRSKSPDKTQSQAWAIGSSAELVDRSYEKPWQRGSKKSKSRDVEKPEGAHKPGRKKPQDWVCDTKITTTTFDDLFQDGHQQEDPARHTREAPTDIEKAWAKHPPLKDAEYADYRSRGYSGPRCHRNDDDPLAGEIMLAAETEKQEESSPPVRTSHIKGPKLGADRHRAELAELLTQDSDKLSTDSGYSGRGVDVEDDAIELLEDPDDLRREGVTNIPTSGYKLSRMLRQRQEDANIKLNINLFTGSAPLGSAVDKQYNDYYDSDLERPATGMSTQYSDYSPGISDDDFESVSQVVGPKPPVWRAPDSDGESSRPKLSKTLPEPARKTKQATFSNTAPVRIAERLYQPEGQSAETANIFLKDADKDTYRVNTKGDRASPEHIRDSMRSSGSQPDSTRYGWNIPDGGTEVSAGTDWTQGDSSVAEPGPPKAY